MTSTTTTRLAAFVGRTLSRGHPRPGPGQRADDPALGRGDGRPEPRPPRRRGRPRHRPRRRRRARRRWCRPGPCAATPRTVDPAARCRRVRRAGRAARRGRLHLRRRHRLRARLRPRAACPATTSASTRSSSRISPEKKTGLGVGRFVTTLKTYRDADGEVVATQRWRTLRFQPAAAARAASEPAALRPRPAINLDNAFWFEAAREHRLVIQRCASCGRLRHPPGPQCPECQSFEWDTVDAAGRRHAPQLHRRPPPAPPRLRLPARRRGGRARRGHPPDRQPRRHHAGRGRHRHAPAARLARRRSRPDPADLPPRHPRGGLMDFHLSEELPRSPTWRATLFTDLSTTDRVRDGRAGRLPPRRRPVGGARQGRARSAWPLPEEHGGAGLGLAAACVVLEEQGRHVAPVALWPHVVGTLAIADSGTPNCRPTCCRRSRRVAPGSPSRSRSPTPPSPRRRGPRRARRTATSGCSPA